ncbi:MAG: hypothetical protein ACK4Z9_03580, partial [Thermodesulfovibrionales bacterium]
TGLIPSERIQYSLFDDLTRIEKMEKVYNVVNRISERFGKHTIIMASSLPTKKEAQHRGERGDLPLRRSDLFKGENKRQRIGVPLLRINPPVA